jgi:dihydroorotase-like cyclic amidohydrolase
MLVLKNGTLMTMCSKTFKGDIAVKEGKIAELYMIFPHIA